jgi:hypothetical protein
MMPAPLDYASPSPPRGTIHRVSVTVVYAALFTALLYLLISHSNINAPMRTRPDEFTFFTESERQLKMADKADPRNAEMEFKMTDPALVSENLSKLYLRTYYMAQYLRCPHRLYLGTDDHIVNDQPQMLAAAKPPPLEWMKQHGIWSIYFVSNTDLLGPKVDVIPVP